MNTPLPSLLLVGAALPLAMAALSAGRCRARLSPEGARKLLHVAMGLLTLAFPWLFASPGPVLALTALALAWFAAVRRLAPLQARFGPVLSGVARPGWGEGCFALGAGLSFWLAQGSVLLHCLPMAILSFADTAAALVGRRLGKSRRGGKSLAGSAAFFCVALGCGLAGLALWAGWPPARAWPLALGLAGLTTLLEALGRRGLDNLLVPLGALALLRLAGAAH